MIVRTIPAQTKPQRFQALAMLSMLAPVALLEAPAGKALRDLEHAPVVSKHRTTSPGGPFALRRRHGACLLLSAPHERTRICGFPASGKAFRIPLGATWDGKGVNFALATAHATKVEVCLFDKDGKEKERIELPEFRGETWHGYVPDIGVGCFYGYRVHGPYAPDEGHRFNPNKLVLDPYARAHFGSLTWNPALFAYKVGDPQADLSFDERDSAPFMPKCVVVDPDFDWKQEKVWKPVPWDRTIVYETHVRGYTKLHPKVPENQRGTYAGHGGQGRHRLHQVARRHLGRAAAGAHVHQR